MKRDYSGIKIYETAAHFNDARTHRWALWRKWDNSLPPRLFIMLNPSTADEIDNDPTVERCFRRSVDDGFGSFIVCNIFALRSTDPSALYSHPDPIGRHDNDRHILQHAQRTHDTGGQIVCAWGTHGRFMGRGQRVLSNLWPFPLHVLGLSKSGEPLHPLYIAYNKKPYQVSLS